VIVDAVEDVSEICQRVKAVELGGFNDGHRTCEGFRTGVGAREEPVFSADSNRTQGTLSGIVIGHAVHGASISMFSFPFVVVGLDIGTGALECEEADRPF